MLPTGTSSFTQYAAENCPHIEAALEWHTRRVDGAPPALVDAMRYSLMAPAKRLRPLLVLMAAEACGGTIERAMPAACAVEMVHTYSLIHDDLPAMDDDDLRRGRPTNHRVFGEGMAILAGDALLAQAFEVLANDVRPPQVAVECCRVLAQAAGRSALVGGQVDDLAGTATRCSTTQDASGIDPQLAALESIHRRKTGAMFLASLRLGGLTAGADTVQLAALERYGENLGLAFQITDDLLDVQGNEAAVGKRLGKDADNGKLTFPGLLGIVESRRRAESLVEEASAVAEVFGPRAEMLEALARYVLERDR